MSDREADFDDASVHTDDVVEEGQLVARVIRRSYSGRPMATILVRPDLRGQGIGDRLLVREQDAGHWLCGRHDERDWYLARGYTPVEKRDDWTLFQPPTEREELRWAASLCLLNPVRRRLILGKRKTPTWQGYWAFPGGGQESGETLAETARREFEEETGIAVRSEALRHATVYVASHSGALYAVTNFLHLCEELPEPEESDELLARWFDFDELPQLSPVAAGTRRILAQVLADYGS